MVKFWLKFSAIFVAALIIDRLIKELFLNGFRWDGEFVSLIFVLNRGVAFSMFEFLGEWLKFLQLGLIVALFIYLVCQKELLSKHSFAFAMLLGAGSSNLLDRFIYGGVVDYIFWHKWFEFAVFNFADVMINLAVAIIFIQVFLEYRKKKK